MSRVSFDPIGAEPQPEAAMEYYNDGIVIVTKRFITLGAPYNQTYNIGAVLGVNYSEDTSGMLGRVMWIFLSVFGLLFGIVMAFQVKSYVMGAFIFAASSAIMYKCFAAFGKWSVQLQMGGLNNQTLNMKNQQSASDLAYCITRAMQDLHAPPDPGQPVSYAPVFPDPVLTRN